jgi:hypothetical protein
MKKDIDLSKATDSDDIVLIEDNIKGVIVLLHGLVFADEAGSHQYQKEAYNTLAIALDKTIADLANVKQGINYMKEYL